MKPFVHQPVVNEGLQRHFTVNVLSTGTSYNSLSQFAGTKAVKA
jgi:hypothetical protein